ncbi:MAG: ACT domain-containing protein [Candidatus Nanohalobium sp.]
MSSAAKVELYISKRPYLKEALAEGIVNYSALARKICEEEGLESFDAVKMAVSRYEDHISSQREERRSKVEEVLGETSMKVRPGVGVVKQEVEDSIVSSETASGCTSVVGEGDKALISLESPEVLESTPGVVEFILSSLAAEGINVDQLISCREDTHLVVEDDEASEAMEVLRERLS